MADRKSRWMIADDNFRRQIDLFMVNSRMTREDIASECGVCHATFNNYYNHPSTMKKRVERHLATLFEAHGMKYDPTMGEGAGA